MTRGLAAATFDLSLFDEGDSMTPESALVRAADGRLVAVDVGRLALPDADATAGVDMMADIASGPFGRC